MSNMGEMIKHAVGALCLAAMAAVGVQAQAPHQYPSPDGRAVAVVTSVPNPPADARVYESEVHISTLAGAFSVPQLDRSFCSFDGEHGYAVVQSAWSPNSEYFVFTGESSGGHSPWHSPAFVYSRRTNVLYSLDECVSGIAVVAPDFALAAPQFARVTVDEGVPGVGFAEKPRVETYDLGAVERGCHDK